MYTLKWRHELSDFSHLVVCHTGFKIDFKWDSAMPGTCARNELKHEQGAKWCRCWKWPRTARYRGIAAYPKIQLQLYSQKNVSKNVNKVNTSQTVQWRVIWNHLSERAHWKCILTICSVAVNSVMALTMLDRCVSALIYVFFIIAPLHLHVGAALFLASIWTFQYYRMERLKWRQEQRMAGSRTKWHDRWERYRCTECCQKPFSWRFVNLVGRILMRSVSLLNSF